MSNEARLHTLECWHQAVQNRDLKLVAHRFSPEIKFFSPFLWKPKEGRDMALLILQTVAGVFEDFTYHRVMTDGQSWTLEFSARIGEKALKGVDIVRMNDEGMIVEFEVMIRPANALEALGAEMGRRLGAG